MNIQSNTVKITPEKAEQMLSGNTMNRPLSSGYVKNLAKQMTDGQWKLSGEPIIISSEGILLDGQHRLSAVVLSGITTDFVVVRGVDKETFKYIDTGKARTSGDVLHISGIENSARVSALAKAIIYYESGAYYATSSSQGVGKKNSKSISNAELLEYVNKNERLIIGCSKIGQKMYEKSKILSRPMYGLLYYVLGNISPVDAETFLVKIASGAGLSEGHVLLKLRNKFIDAKVTGRPYPPKVVLGMVFNCWNLFRQGRASGRFNFDSSEELPKLI